MEGKIKKINIPLVGVLNIIVFLAFFFAKIYDKIDWNWWWIFSPLWIPIAFIFGIIIICIFVMLLKIAVEIWKLR